MSSGKMGTTIPQLWGWADWIRIFLLPVAGCVAWIRSFISLSLRSPKCEMGLTMGLSSQGCCEKWWGNVCRPLADSCYSDGDDYNCCWCLVTSLPSTSGFSSVYDPTAQGYGEAVVGRLSSHLRLINRNCFSYFCIH